MVQVVKLANAGEAGLQHLGIGQGRHGLEVVRVKREGEAVHHLPPGPEGIVFRPADFGEPGHTALEGMAVQVRHARQADGLVLVPGGRRRTRPDRSDQAVGDLDPDIARPAGRRERFLEEQDGHARVFSFGHPGGGSISGFFKKFLSARGLSCLY